MEGGREPEIEEPGGTTRLLQVVAGVRVRPSPKRVDLSWDSPSPILGHLIVKGSRPTVKETYLRRSCSGPRTVWWL